MWNVLYCGCMIPEEDRARYLSMGCKITATGPLSHNELLDAVKGMDAIVPGGEEKVTEDVLKAGKDTLKVVSFHGVGYEYYVDSKSAANMGIAVTNVPDKNSTTVSEFTAALISSMVKRIVPINNITKGGVWDKHINYDIGCLTIGIVGMGNIGRKVARIMHNGFGANIVYNSHKRRVDVENEYGAKYLDLHELCKISDVITLHLPFTDETNGIIDEGCFSLMKDTAYLVNTSRAEIVSEKALYDALSKDKIRCAAMDCFYNNRIPEGGDEYGLSKLSDDKLIVTPHVAYWTPNTLRAVEEVVMDNIIKVLGGHQCDNIVNGVNLQR